jgi:hypothetical protein
MADNVTLGSATYATDEISGVHYHRGKTTFGVDGVATDVSASNPLPVVQTGTPALPTGAATETTLAALNTKTPALGAAVSASSVPVTIATETASGNITTQNLVPNGAATANSAVELILNGMQGLSIQVTGTYTGALSVQLTNDNSRWETTTQTSIVNALSGVPAATIASASVGLFETRVGGFLRARVTGLAPMTGTATVTLRATTNPGVVAVLNPTAAAMTVTASIAATQTLATVTTLTGGAAAEDAATTSSPHIVGGVVRTATSPTTLVAGDAARATMTSSGAIVTLTGAVPEITFNYPAAASGIVNTTTAVQVRAAQAASIRTYVRSMQVQTATLGAATELVLRDGAAGTVMFRTQLQTTAMPLTTITFDPPLRGTAATLLEVATLTAVTGGVFVNVQGYSAA